MKTTLLLLILCPLILFVGCSKKPANTKQTQATATEPEFVLVPLVADETDEVQPLEGLGPNGEKPVGVDALQGLITDEDAKNYMWKKEHGFKRIKITTEEIKKISDKMSRGKLKIANSHPLII